MSSEELKREALRLGFSHVGLAPAEPVPDEVMARYEAWLRRGWQGDMHYLENHLAIRRDPRLLLPGAKTVISLAMSYNPGDQPTQRGIAWYAQGRDYHDVIKEKLRELTAPLPAPPVGGRACIQAQSPQEEGKPSPPRGERGEGPLGRTRICVDTAPIMEKYWAWRCGLGWIGRHTQLVIPGEGSAFFLAEVLTTEEADHYDEPLTRPQRPLTRPLSPLPPWGGGPALLLKVLKRKASPPPCGGSGERDLESDLCGTCRRCLDACPTHAITEEGMDARRCLSYLTIEHRGPLPRDMAPYLRDCFYGCDRCLRACPHLSRATASPVADFRPSPALLAMSASDWSHLSPDDYRSLFRGSAVKRAKFEGLCRNIRLHDAQDE